MFVVVQDLPDHPAKHFVVITLVSMYVYAILLHITNYITRNYCPELATYVNYFTTSIVNLWAYVAS